MFEGRITMDGSKARNYLEKMTMCIVNYLGES